MFLRRKIKMKSYCKTNRQDRHVCRQTEFQEHTTVRLYLANKENYHNWEKEYFVIDLNRMR